MPVPSKYISMNDVKTKIPHLNKDYNKMGVCIPNKAMNHIHKKMIGIDSEYGCKTYKDCLTKKIFNKNFEITITDPTSMDPVLSGQTFHFREYAVPLQIKIPKNSDYSSLPTDGNFKLYRENYNYLDNSYGNSLCKDAGTCTINVAIPSNISTTPPPIPLPKKLQIVREGINCPSDKDNCYKNSGPCEVANKTIYRFNNPSENPIIKYKPFKDIVGKDIPTPSTLIIKEERGVDYYYFLEAFDNGTNDDMVLNSSKFYTLTNKAAALKRPPGESFKDIRVVPNPFHISARDLQYGVSAPDRLMFLNIPPVCTIRIFTERGDLVDTIEHTDGSGDEAWNSITSSRQIIVSGLYIAHFDMPDGDAIRKFTVVR